MMITSSTSEDPSADIDFDKLWTLEDTFSHQDFRLLYVPPKDEHDRMMIITPSKHEPSYVPDRKFYALSHLWHTDPKDNLWEVSDFISDENGTTVEPIPMRKEKRDTFLKLLQDNPGYWWIDVLCCRTDLPPVIIRGVYGCCHTCFAMIDCPPKAIEYFLVVLPQFKVVRHFPVEVEFPPLPDPISTLKKGCKYATDIWKCRWFSRVWTLQELALPTELLLLSETCDTPCYVSADKLSDQLCKLQEILSSHRYYSGDILESFGDFNSHLSALRRDVKTFQRSKFEENGLELFLWILDLFGTSERSCYFAEDYVYGVLGILGWDIPRLSNMEDLWNCFLSCLQRFAEKVLGLAIRGYFAIIRIYADSGDYETCKEATIKHCQETIRINISKEALRTLSGVCSMKEVYQGLALNSTTDCSCFYCDAVLDFLDSFSGSPPEVVVWNTFVSR